jgi:hypothetical protein
LLYAVSILCMALEIRWRSARCQHHSPGCVRGERQTLFSMMFTPAYFSFLTSEISTKLPIKAFSYAVQKPVSPMRRRRRRLAQDNNDECVFYSSWRRLCIPEAVDDTHAAEQVRTCLLANSRRRGQTKCNLASPSVWFLVARWISVEVSASFA